MRNYKEGLSVIVCTYNREVYIEPCLEKISKSLQRCDFDCELIIVNNNSTDNTSSILNNINLECNYSVYLETRPGLSHARNLGISLAENRVVAFVDDDAFVLEDWASNIFMSFKDQKVGSVGGKILPKFEEIPPNWFSEKYHSLYSILDIDAPFSRFSKGFGPVGANMAVDISKLDDEIYFDTDLGRKGESLLSGEEVEFLRRFKKLGFTSYYNPDAVVFHVIPKERLQKGWAMKRFYWGGISDYISQPTIVRKFAVSMLSLRAMAVSFFLDDKFFFECNKSAFIGIIHKVFNKVNI